VTVAGGAISAGLDGPGVRTAPGSGEGVSVLMAPPNARRWSSVRDAAPRGDGRRACPGGAEFASHARFCYGAAKAAASAPSLSVFTVPSMWLITASRCSDVPFWMS
jgi:hypothetical protein